MRTVDAREQEIFLEAIQIESAIERKDYVYQACADNENLRTRVENLLKIQSDGSFILDKDVGINHQGEISSDIAQTADLTGTTLDKFHLVRLIGSGGMGDVYLAEQREPIRRRVAVKVIKLGLDTKNFVARFAEERQALALMDHEGITKVFDAGSTKTGRPYFAMELVSGDPITTFCDEKRLSIEQRLQIFALLCKAIEHAHQKGVIHRDLKPSNILVVEKDGEFLPKIIDFGVSKATTERVPGHTDLTRLACMIGTPEYMSPEQTDTQGNDQDIRTDVYSMGAILFELLTGTSPFELEELKKKNLLKVREIIQTRRVERPSSRVKILPDTKPQVFRDRESNPVKLIGELKGNLDAIVLKCLSKDRDERYSAVSELAEDINRHLNGDPARVLNLNWWGRLATISKKKRRAVVGTILLLAAFAAMTILSIHSMVRANHFAAQALESEAAAKTRLSEANRARREAQLEKARTINLESQLIADQKRLVNQSILLKAIAKFNKQPSDETKRESFPALTMWLKNQLSPEVRDALPELESNDGDAKNGKGDIRLLNLWLAEQRLKFGNEDIAVAATLDLLGEKHLGLGNHTQAITYLRESLFIRTDIEPKSEKRILTMILLAKSLRNSGKEIEANTYIESVSRLLERFPSNSRYSELIREYQND